MTRYATGVAFMVASIATLATAALAQTPARPDIVNGKSLTFDCVSDAQKKNISILVTNPNGVDKKCDLKCSYTASDKKSYAYSCRGQAVFKQANKLEICAEGHPQGPAPYSDMKAEGTCN